MEYNKALVQKIKREKKTVIGMIDHLIEDIKEQQKGIERDKASIKKLKKLL